jgi:hypothetical protein
MQAFALVNISQPLRTTIVGKARQSRQLPRFTVARIYRFKKKPRILQDIPDSDGCGTVVS